MNSQQIQFKSQRAASLLLAGLILALAASLAWTGTDASASTLQPAKMVRGGVYSLQPGPGKPSAADVVCHRVDFWRAESGLLPWFQPMFIAGSKPGGVGDGVNFTGGKTELPSWFQLKPGAGSKPGTGTDG